MITVIIGQRGTGKTSLLRRIEYYLQSKPTEYRIYDLDSIISEKENKTIEDIFKEKSEDYFRLLERKYFEIVLSQNSSSVNVFISVGGGFNVNWIPAHVRIIYLQRESEKLGRVFLDRPPLTEMSALVEYFLKTKQRAPLFKEVAWEEYLIPEGVTETSSFENDILIDNPSDVGGILTILPNYFSNEDKWNYFIQRRLLWDLDYFELRDDLLSSDQIKKVLQYIPIDKILFSRRSDQTYFENFENEFKQIDFDRNFLISNCEKVKRSIIEINKKIMSLIIVSVHEYRDNETLDELLEEMENFEKKGFHIKIAIEINNFVDLKRVHDWTLNSINSRSFLPRSKDGRWMWYRLWMGRKQKINFWREGEGSSSDQPSLYLWLQNNFTSKIAYDENSNLNKFINDENKSKIRVFSALLGSPVQHSFTPIFQGIYFNKWGIPVYPIDINPDEFQFAMNFLDKIGLTAAAVTSPLKLLAYQYCINKTSQANEFLSVNTLAKDIKGNWLGHNTDEKGLQVLIDKSKVMIDGVKSLTEVAVAIWGGGGTLPLIKKLIPNGESYSIQTGNHREHKVLNNWNPEVVIWAGNGLHDPGTQPPPKNWCPKLVVDLNYKDNSGGKEWAIQVGCRYINGLSMFYAQAEGQREFWSSHLNYILLA